MCPYTSEVAFMSTVYYNILENKIYFLGEHVQTINIKLLGLTFLNTFIIVFVAQEEGKGRGRTIRKGHERMKACILGHQMPVNIWRLFP